MIAEFINRGPKSFFQEVLKCRSNDQSIDFHVSLKVTAVDLEIENICKTLKEAKRIDSYYRCFMSGKIVLLKNGQRRSINAENDLLVYWRDDCDQASFSSGDEIF